MGTTSGNSLFTDCQDYCHRKGQNLRASLRRQREVLGLNDNGQLGYGDTNTRGDSPGSMGKHLPSVDLGSGRSAKFIAAGGYHTCAILDDGSTKCWGANPYGQLGYGDTTNRGDDGGEMGDGLPSVDLGSGRSAKFIAAGDSHTCAILDDGSVKCWGQGSDGGLGYGDTLSRGDGAGVDGRLLACC